MRKGRGKLKKEKKMARKKQQLWDVERWEKDGCFFVLWPRMTYSLHSVSHHPIRPRRDSNVPERNSWVLGYMDYQLSQAFCSPAWTEVTKWQSRQRSLQNKKVSPVGIRNHHERAPQCFGTVRVMRFFYLTRRDRSHKKDFPFVSSGRA